MASIYSNEEHI